MLRSRARALWFASLIAALLGLAGTRPLRAAEEYNFAGSVQLDYNWLPGVPHAVQAPSPVTTFQGFTAEAALKVAVDVSEHLSANVKACYGCHGLELDMGYFDYRAADEFNVRVGRFSPSFGAFTLRHDPANHMLSDKPLPYDMGRMQRRGDWNGSVLPSPFPSNGIEINGTHWVGNEAQFDYALYAVGGFKNDNNPHPYDFNFQASHQLYYVDNATHPATGGRLALTLKGNEAIDVTLGASAMLGTYGPKSSLAYVIGGADFTVRVQRTALRAEYLVRRQQMDISNPDSFKYTSEEDFFVKQGAYAEIEQPLSSFLDFTARADALWRRGNVAKAPLGSSGPPAPADVNPLQFRAYILRETVGLELALERNFRLKGSTELWQFSYADSIGDRTALGFHLGAVGSF